MARFEIQKRFQVYNLSFHHTECLQGNLFHEQKSIHHIHHIHHNNRQSTYIIGSEESGVFIRTIGCWKHLEMIGM